MKGKKGVVAEGSALPCPRRCLAPGLGQDGWGHQDRDRQVMGTHSSPDLGENSQSSQGIPVLDPPDLGSATFHQNLGS